MNDVLGPHTKEEKLRSLKEKYMMTTSLETMAAIIKKPSVSQWVEIQCRPGLLWTIIIIIISYCAKTLKSVGHNITT